LYLAQDKSAVLVAVDCMNGIFAGAHDLSARVGGAADGQRDL
jgi:hypothetical protein